MLGGGRTIHRLQAQYRDKKRGKILKRDRKNNCLKFLNWQS